MHERPISELIADEPDKIGMAVTAISLIAWGVTWYLLGPAHLAFLVLSVVVISIVIWQACDPFADAAQWVGTTLHLPGSVRGATLDAIASSMPELFTGIFFVLVAVQSPREGAEFAATEGEGYGSAIATCAGSAVYNMMLIPAVCAIVIRFSRPSRPTIDVEDEVIHRDGMWFLGAEMVLLIFLFQPQMYWWMGIVFLAAYVGYIVHLSIDARRFRRKMPIVRETIHQLGAEASAHEIHDALAKRNVRVSTALIMRVYEDIHSEEDSDEGDDAGAIFGLVSIPMSHLTAWPLLLVCTILAATACYFLVDVTNTLAETLKIPAFFVAVIVAAAASSVPDTFMSIGASQRGDDDGAVSNAFGSNIFDICVCLSIPLLVNSYLNGWAPVSLLDTDGEPIEGLTGLRVLLWVLSLITLMIIYHRRQLTFKKALLLVLLYLIFVGYAVIGSLGLVRM